MKAGNDNTQSIFDRGGVLAPWLFYGEVAPSTERQFLEAPKLSLYWDVVSSVLYVKKADTGSAADWQPMIVASTTITGDITISGTLTAGDVVVSA